MWLTQELCVLNRTAPRRFANESTCEAIRLDENGWSRGSWRPGRGILRKILRLFPADVIDGETAKPMLAVGGLVAAIGAVQHEITGESA
jgi:hypothetical protein